MQKNDRLSLFVEDLSFEGAGVARAEGQVVFIEGALPHEKVRAHILKVTSKYALAKMVALESDPNPRRRQPACSRFGKCGGCRLQHMAYSLQLELKRRQVEDCFARAGLSCPVSPVIPSEKEYYYRNKGAFPVGMGQKGPEVGMYAPRSHRIIPGTDCPLHQPEVTSAIQAVESWMREHRVPGWREEKGQGLIRHIMARNTAGGVMAVIVASSPEIPRRRELLRVLETRVRGLASVIWNVNDRDTNVILGPESRCIWGEPALTEAIGGLSFRVSAHAFLQVNPYQTPRLYSEAAGAAALTGTQRVYDAYCGLGTIGQLLAKDAASVLGVEETPAAVEDAVANAAANGIPHASYLAGRAEEVFPKWVARGEQPDVLVVDPPRKGCHPDFIDAALEAGPGRIVYVSCNPATLARDAALLSAGGYRPVYARPLDMFPQTPGVETVVLMSRV